MKPGVLLLIIGGSLLVSGLLVAGISTFSVTTQILEGSTIIDSTSLEPNLSIAAVSVGLPAGQRLLLSLATNPPDATLQASITDPDGNTLALYNITETPFTGSTTTKVAGDHTLEIRNVGSSPVTVSGALLNSLALPQGGGINLEDDPSVQTLVTYGTGILVGIVLIIAGIVVLVIGGIVYVRGRKDFSSARPDSTMR
ncbi:MAG: hypothetical protein AB1351_13735 [Thermoproteota archaeon]